MALKPITLKDTAQTMYGSDSAEFGIKENIQAAAGKVKSGATRLKRKAGMALREAASKGSEMAREATGVVRTEGGKFVSKAKGKASNSAKKAADMVAKKRAAAGFRASSNAAEFRKVGSKNKQRKLRNTLLGTTTAGRLTRGIGAAALLGGAARLVLRKKGAIVAGSSSPYGRAALPGGNRPALSASKYSIYSNAAEFAKKMRLKDAILGKTKKGKIVRAGAALTAGGGLLAAHLLARKGKGGGDSGQKALRGGGDRPSLGGGGNRPSLSPSSSAEVSIPRQKKKEKAGFRSGATSVSFGLNPFAKPKKSGVVGAIVGKTTAGKVARVGALAGAVGLGLAAKRYGGQAGAAASLAGQKSRTTLQPKAMDTVSSVKAAGASVGRQIKSDIGGVTNAAKNAAANVKSSIGGFIPKKKPKQLSLPGG